MSDDRCIGIQLGDEDFQARVRAARIDQAELARRYGRNGQRAPDALPADVISARLEELVYMVLSMRRSVRPPAEALAWFPGPRVEGFFQHLEQVARTSLDLTYHLCVQAPEVLRHLPDEEIHDWIIALLETYDRSGTQGGIRAMREIADHAATLRARRCEARLDAVRPVLEAFVTGLAGRGLRLAAGEASFTDTETLFLPERLGQFPDPADNFRLYKAIATHLWAQTWYGTWREPALEHLAAFPDAQRALALFQSIEGLRLDARIAADLPGLWREILRLDGEAARPDAWRALAEQVGDPAFRVADSWALVAALHATPIAPLAPRLYQGAMDPQRVAETMARRVARERERMAAALAQMADEPGAGRCAPDAAPPVFGIAPTPDEEWSDGFAFQLTLNDQPIRPPAETLQLMRSIVQDFGQIPPEYLTAAGQGVYPRAAAGTRDTNPPTLDPESFVYDEWDAGRQGYRKGWCQLREREIHPRRDDFVPRTRIKYQGLLKHLHRTFEALRGEERLIKREPFGDDPDIDALVEAHAERARGLEMTDRLFLRRRKLERHLAVLFMVDMSGSTKGWINEALRESLVLLCESLERLGDRYAIHGFSGYTHTRCEIYPIKDFAEPYDAAVQARISGIEPRDYTRMGAAMRHLTRKLVAVEARTRVLMVLSDGRPDDEDGYRGDYGIEDTRQAVLEARGQGIHPFCVTIDDQAQEYLPRLFGPSGYVLVESVQKLPYRVSDIYRRIAL